MLQNSTRRIHLLVIPLITAFFSTSIELFAQPPVIFQSRITGLSGPIDVVNAGDGTNRFFIAEQKTGTIKGYNQSYGFLGNLLTVTGMRTLGNEEGLLSIAFHPNYETNRYFYTYYTNSDGNLQLDRYQTRADNPNLADPASKDTVLVINHPGNDNHNGAKLLFGSDGYLYFATGDGGSGDDPPNNAQNGMVLLGKMLRINVTTTETPPFYTIPPDNPYVSNPSVADEIWAAGLRNPFRWSFDRLTGDMWIGDVGQDQVEEINFRAAGTTAGVNYGWRCYEGTHPNITAGCAPQASYISPVYEYPTPPSPTAVTGGIVYRGSNYPSLYGYYMASEFYDNTLFLIAPNGSGGWTTTPLAGLSGIAGFGESENGELFAVRLTTGTLYQLTGTEVVPVFITAFAVNRKNNFYELEWKVTTEQNVKEYSIEASENGVDFSKVGQVTATSSNIYRFVHKPLHGNKFYYRLRIIDMDGSFEFSKVIFISAEINPRVFVRPSVIYSNILNLQIDGGYKTIQIVNSTGSIVFSRSIAERRGSFTLTIPRLPAGNYLVRLEGPETSVTQKIIVK